MLYPVPGGVLLLISAAIAGRKNIQINFIIGKGEIGLGRGETRRGLLEASLTLEASLSLTVFIFAVIILAMPMEMLDTQRKIQTVLETTARELSQYAYIFYRRTEGEELRDTDGTDSLVTAEAFAEGAGTGISGGENQGSGRAGENQRTGSFRYGKLRKTGRRLISGRNTDLCCRFGCLSWTVCRRLP